MEKFLVSAYREKPPNFRGASSGVSEDSAIDRHRTPLFSSVGTWNESFAEVWPLFAGVPGYG